MLFHGLLRAASSPRPRAWDRTATTAGFARLVEQRLGRHGMGPYLGELSTDAFTSARRPSVRSSKRTSKPSPP